MAFGVAAGNQFVWTAHWRRLFQVSDIFFKNKIWKKKAFNPSIKQNNNLKFTFNKVHTNIFALQKQIRYSLLYQNFLNWYILKLFIKCVLFYACVVSIKFAPSLDRLKWCFVKTRFKKCWVLWVDLLRPNLHIQTIWMFFNEKINITF